MAHKIRRPSHFFVLALPARGWRIVTFERYDRLATEKPQRERLHGGGERSAFGDLFARYQLPLLDFLYGMTRDRDVAADLVQETFLRAYASTETLASIMHPQAWLYRIATNLALNRSRRGRRFDWVSLGHIEPQAGMNSSDEWIAPTLAERLPSQDMAATVAERDAVWGVLAELPPRWRAVLLLQTAGGFEVSEIAALLHLSEANVRNMLFRAKERFRAIYARLEAKDANETKGGQR